MTRLPSGTLEDITFAIDDGWLHAKTAEELIEWHKQRRRQGKVRCVDCVHRPEPELGWERVQVRFCTHINQYIHVGDYWRRCLKHEPVQKSNTHPQPRLRLVSDSTPDLEQCKIGRAHV